MRAWLLVCAALVAAGPAAAAHTRDPHRTHGRVHEHDQHNPHGVSRPDPARLDRIKSQILAKLGMTERPRPLGAPPHDVVRAILARAGDQHHHHDHDYQQDEPMREVIAIAQKDKCTIGCKGSPTGNAFLNGHKYNYGVEGTVTIFLTGTEKQETSVKLLGQVSVTALGNCAHELTVQNIVISGPDGKKYQPPPGIEKPVQFSLQDGRVGIEICAQEGDTRRSLNIKRAIISLLQTEQKPATQVDVFGICPTDVSSSQEGGAVLVHRARDLSRCSHREQGKNDLITGITNLDAGIKETQVLQSSLNVETKVNNGVPEKVSATEEYLYKPFSIGENGARAKVHTKLTLTGKASGGGGGSHCAVSRTIIFENPHGVSTAQSNANTALSAVKDVAKSVVNEASSKSAGNFAQLVRIFRVTSKEDLLKVFGQVKGQQLEKRVFLDALLRAGTGESIETSIQVLKSHELSDLEQQLVFLSLGNARHVNDDALKAAAGLLDVNGLPKEVYLGAGALAGAYCREHPCHSSHPPAPGLVALSNKLAAKLHNCRPKTKPDEDSVVAVLKGIRSIRHLEDSLIEKLVHCAADNNAKARVRAAALEAFHADPCSAKIKKTAIDLMKNRQLDSEIRIQAYLAVIQCPCGHSANEIKNLLDSEPVHQVGNFITTSLRHIRASSNPDKRLARQHYGLIRTPNKFNSDDRKYSFYREMSYKMDALGSSGSIDQTVIYSQDSFLPRSINLNLTVEMFGHSYNVFELGGRQGNLDRVMEHFLGPKSFLRDKDPQAVYDDLVKRYEESKKKVEGLSRGRRSIKSEIDNFDKNLKAESIPYNNELDLDIYVKLFGTDAVFLSFGDDKGFDFNKILDQILGTCNTGINKLKHFQQDVRAHLLFLDGELSYPTSAGLPLRLSVVGAAAARLDFASNTDLRQIMQNPQSAKIDIKFVPSTDVEISGALLVDADSVTTGLKVITNLHSSTGVHVIVKVLENGRGFDLQLGLPVDKQEIVQASNDLVYFTSEKGQKEKQVPIKVEGSTKDYAACFDQLSGMVGLTLCAELSAPFAMPNSQQAKPTLAQMFTRFPLSGSSKVKLVLEKNDLRGYHVKGVIREDKNAGRKSFELLFDAEGSQNRRTQLSGEFTYNNNEVGVKLGLDSPIKVLQGEIFAYQKPSEVAAVIKAKIDTTDYYGRIGFNGQGNERRSVYKPIFEYSLPDDNGKKHEVQIEGQVIRECNGPLTKYTFDGINFKMPNSGDSLGVSGHLSHQQNPRLIDFDVKIADYASLKGSVKETAVEIDFDNKLNPYVSFTLKGQSEFKDTIHNEFDLYYGSKQDPARANNRITFYQSLKRRRVDSTNDYNIITKNSFEIYAIPIKVLTNADIDPKKVFVEVGGQYMEKSAKFDLAARTKIKKQGDYSVKIKANADKASIEVFAKRDIVSADKSNLENYIDVKGIGRYELSGVCLHKTKPNDMNIGAIGHLKMSGGGKNEDINFDIGALENPNTYSSHAKVSSGAGVMLDFLVKATRGANPGGELKFQLKDSISANGQYKVTDKDGKGNGMLVVDFKKLQRKIKADVVFVAKEPVFDAEVNVYPNFDKDNNDKFCFVTSNKKTEKLLDSKNKLEYSGKRFEVNVHQDGIYALVGKSHAIVELVLPTERCLTLKVDRDVTLKDELYNGNVDLVLSDSAKRGSSGSSITYKGKIVNTNFDKEIFDYEGQLDFKLKDGKQLQNTFTVKHAPEGDKNKFDFKGDVTGNLLAKAASLSVSYLYDDTGLLSDTDDKYRMQAHYGDDIRIQVDGVWQFKFPEKGDRKYVDDFTVTMRLPFEKCHDAKWVSTYLYVKPENQEAAEYTLVESLQMNADVYKIDANGKLGPKDGFGAVKLLVPHVDPLMLDFNYKNGRESEKSKNFVEVKTKYGKGKSASISVDSLFAPHDSTLVVKANAPHNEKLKKLEFTVHAKNPSPDTYNNLVIVDADSRIYKSESTIVLSKAHPILDIQYTSPASDKVRKVYIKGSSLSSTQGKVEIKVDNVYDVSLDLVSEASVQKDNVAFKVQANSEKFGWKNYNVDISSKDAGSGKRLEFHATNDNKNVLSGSTSFISKQEGQKTIIEGSGSVKLKEEQKSANFKYIRTVLTEGNEKGVEAFFNIAIGDRSYVAESRVTNLEYKNSYVYCEEKKQCAHAEIQSKIDMSKPGVIVNTMSAGFDLRKLGVAPEFGAQLRDEVSAERPPQHTLDLHVNKGDNKYHLHAYNTPEHGTFLSGVTIRIPSRVLAFESTLTYPKDKTLPLPIKGEVYLDLDKNRPGHKTSARFLVDSTGNENQHTGVAEIGFLHPKIDKEAVIRVNGKVNHPGDNTFILETSASLCHSSLGKDRVAKILFEYKQMNVKFLAESPFMKMLEVEGTVSGGAGGAPQKGALVISLCGAPPVRAHALLKDYQYFEIAAEESNQKFTISGHLEPEKRVDISADIYLSGDKKNIAHGALFLQDNLVKSDYGLSKENFQYFLNALKKDLDTLKDQVQAVGEKTSKEVESITKRVTPYFKKIDENFSEEWNKFYHEIANDKTIQELSQVFHEILTFLAKVIDEFQHMRDGIKPMVDAVIKTYVDITTKMGDMYKKEIEPHVQKLYSTFGTILKEYLDGVVEVLAHFAALVTDFFEKHKPELQELTSVITEIFKDLTRLLVAQLKEFPAKISETYHYIVEQVTTSPLYTNISEKWKEFAVPEQILNLLKEAHDAIKKLLPTTESQDFAECLNAYVQKKLRNQPVDDSKELRVIFQKLVSAVTSLAQFVRAQLGEVGAPTVLPAFDGWLLSPSPLKSAPSLAGEWSWSVLKQLWSGDAPDLVALLRAYRPRSINPLDEVPAKLRAVVVNGQHIFTFDGRHLTFPGTCRYVLAHDHVDRNFTLLLQLANGQPKALVLEDKSGVIIELKDNGQVTVNGAAHGFPVIEQDVSAFRQANGRIGLSSRFGLTAFCTAKLEVCYFEVSGFYLGKLRGLLGDGNNEPYDDFRLPNGKICTSESEFGNAYRLARSCPQAQAPEHSHHQLHHAALPAACDKVFGGVSPLRPLSLVLDVAPFRQACIHAVGGSDAAKDLHQACDLARGYAALALSGLLPAALPSACLSCSDADKPHAVGDSYEIKLPAKQADLVISFETTVDNEKIYKDLVIPLVSQLIDTLKSKRITDIKVYLVGHTSKHPYPILYDTDSKLKNAKVQFDDQSRYDRIPFVSTGNEYVDKTEKLVVDFVNDLKIKLGLNNIDASKVSLLELPLRAGAVKHLMMVVGEQCQQEFFLLEALESLSYSVVFDNMALSASLVTVTPDLKIGGGKSPSDVVGFNEQSVLLLGDKKQTKENEALRPTLEVQENSCINFVQSVGGTVVSASAFSSCEASRRTQFVATAASALAQGVVRETLALQCACAQVDPFRARSLCYVKDRRETARRRK